MTHTAKLVEARDRIKALMMKKRDQVERLKEIANFASTYEPIINEVAGLDIAVRVIEDLLQE